MKRDNPKDVKYVVTGVDRNGKRFSITYSDLMTANCINLWRGSVWRESGGKRTLLKRVYN